VPSVFVSHHMVQQWTEHGYVELDDAQLRFAAEQTTVTLTPAVRFLRLIEGNHDPHELLGRVKTKAQLATLGAEHYLDSVLLGDVAYVVLEGYRGELRAQPIEASSTTVALSATMPPSLDSLEDAIALSALFLSTVREK
jgi:hypothetical protein